ncbi:biopolymer transporter ExbD [Saccharophagus sp. K07]|mgnify:CR=1 FL=1|uniref:ExbD/TolR family protein n=1 Tax=Saccharophagus sp. K07 TaxID=2283636 RepID=UPI0016522849|nr:biopolymer transporter ExbD [Saccharophagus sp. K07]
MHFRRQSKQHDEINLTPLIDVVFLLLIFFMVSTTFTKETHLKVDLPEAEGQQAPQQVEQIEIMISANGDYAVNGENLVNSQMQTLLTAIEQKGQGNKDLPFIITADANVPYEKVVQVMDAAGRLGYTKLSMTTKRPVEK